MSLANTTWVIDSTKSFTSDGSWRANGSYTYQKTNYISFFVNYGTITLVPTPPDRVITICSNGTWAISAPLVVNSVTSNEDKLETLLRTYASQQAAAIEMRSFSIDGTDYTIAVMEGATALKAGKKGFVPAPPASSQASALYLNGVGQWVQIPMPVDNLNSTSTSNSLSANQGKVLNDTKAPINNPVFTNSITIGATTLTEAQLQSLLANSNIPSANGVIF